MFRITHSDLSDYTCVARNGEGRIHHTVRVVIAGKKESKIFLCLAWQHSNCSENPWMMLRQTLSFHRTKASDWK